MEQKSQSNPMWVFHQKLKALSHALSLWSRQQYGKIVQKTKEYEQKVKDAELIWAQTNNDADRISLNELKAQYVRHLKVEQDVLQQKTQLQWFKEGDANSRYFHSLIRGRRRKLYIHKIKNEEETHLCQSSRTLFSMNPTSAAGPDGMNGKFYQACWEVIKEDLLKVVLAFFRGSPMPRYMTNACLVLLPKVEFPNSLTEFRPISLRNFINKIISKVIFSRLGPILPKIISANQSGFVKGRNISENIMFAQEIVHGIKKPTMGSNMVIKLDMAKAYDRVSWSFTYIMLRRMGFSEMIVDMIWRTMSNNWYSVIVNGTRYLFHGFYMEKRGPQINRLSFAVDIIIFTSGRRTSLRKIMWILSNYESTSGQLINRHKSHFMTAPCAMPSAVRRIQRETGFSGKDSPLTYLGCPLYIGRSRIMHFNGLISKVLGRIKGWHGKMLSDGGRATLIKYVLQSLPIHLLSAVSPPKTVMKQIERLTANFFWGMDKDKHKYHWASWFKLSFPPNEGGVGFRTIQDSCKAMKFKQWWQFRTANSLWSSFLKAKYCQTSNPISKKWDSGQSQAWKRMMFNKKEAKKVIQWRLHNGKCSFWWDNWLGSMPIAFSRTEGGRPGNTSVSNFWNEGRWDLQKLNGTAPAHKISEIMQTAIYYNPDLPDKPIWTPTIRGKFTCTSAWDLIRKKKPPSFTNRRIWCVCCSMHALETVEHLFSSGNFARIIWKKYGGHVGIQTENLPLRLLLMKWWMMKACNFVQKLILDTLPIIICWNLWKNRCSAKYGAKNTSLTTVLYSINSDINLLLRSNFPVIQWPFNWRELYSFIENIQHHTTIIQVKWTKPDKGFVKINSDGSAMTNPGKIGGGVIIRDQQGHFIHAMTFPLGEGTNNYAETEAARIGVQWCLDNGIPRVHLEADFALLVRWLTEDNDSPWVLKQKISHLRLLCSQFEGFKASHVYREANCPADSLLKLSQDLNTLTNFTTASSLPPHIRGQVLHDQLGTPAFRHKKTNMLIVPFPYEPYIPLWLFQGVVLAHVLILLKQQHRSSIDHKGKESSQYPRPHHLSSQRTDAGHREKQNPQGIELTLHYAFFLALAFCTLSLACVTQLIWFLGVVLALLVFILLEPYQLTHQHQPLRHITTQRQQKMQKAAVLPEGYLIPLYCFTLQPQPKQPYQPNCFHHCCRNPNACSNAFSTQFQFHNMSNTYKADCSPHKNLEIELPFTNMFVNFCKFSEQIWTVYVPKLIWDAFSTFSAQSTTVSNMLLHAVFEAATLTVLGHNAAAASTTGKH
ncbi:PREDICTED: uncharacterized protein LOC109215963 [Nicotiana attenuata]|uniref:uncharacterized protein LOC109215963 n=1 Tax=Nicotiana attenuata TaxID=49451 RepID=UPI000904DD43|nr:PREDICTED: uncharacterized protein LOC109215963 [Nicotiana attenuata]